MDFASEVDPKTDGTLLILFVREAMPGHDEIVSAIESCEGIVVSHSDPQAGLIEILRDGMTFDIVGTTEATEPALPPTTHRFGHEGELALERKRAIALRPGAHVAAGMRLTPIFRTMLGAAAAIVTRLEQTRALIWPPSASLIGPNFFVSSVEAWISGGPFPALGLTAFALRDDGALASQGLAFFVGQELLLDRELAGDRTSGVRLGIRLANLLIARGRLDRPEDILGPDGNPLRLQPSSDGRTVFAKPG